MTFWIASNNKNMLSATLRQLAYSLKNDGLIFVWLLVLFVIPFSSHAATANTSDPLFVEPEIKRLEGGRFTIGCLDKHPNCEQDERVKELDIKPFSAGLYEVTNKEFVRFLNATGKHKNEDGRSWVEIQQDDPDSRIILKDGGYSVEPGYEDYPVIEVCWLGATHYAEWLSEQTAKPYRLLTEAEWEYMARAGNSKQYPWGEEVGADHANCDGCAGTWGNKRELKKVGSYAPNSWGFYDVVGNAWEFTCSKYQWDSASQQSSCSDLGSEQRRVTRGGSWYSEPWDIRLSNRAFMLDWQQDYQTGFRLAMDEVPQP